MFVGVRLASGAVNRGFLVPQAGLLRDDNGPYVLIVGPEDEVSQKRVTVDTLRGADWIVTGGLADGDRVIVSGTQNARPGSRVVPVAAAADAAPPAAAAASR
jgi:membrane fusion protein (multidrug efflux system)